jgi:trehalose 2-sulfotransferase
VYFHHKFDHVFEDSPPPSVSFIVCSLPRSGSSLLCDLLASTELAGAPTEFFDLNQMNEFKRIWGVGDFDAYLDALVARKTSPNGLFGVKAHYHQLMDAFAERDIEGAFPNLRLVYIKRADRIRQAVSFALATQTERWTSAQEEPAAAPAYDAGQIAMMIDWIEREEQAWERWFAAVGAPLHRIVYEDFAEAIEPTLVEVLRFLTVEVGPDFEAPAPTLHRQADRLNDEWAVRYRAELARR